MKAVRFLLLLLVTAALIVALNSKFGRVPPLGKLLNPKTGFLKNAEGKNFSFSKTDFPELKKEVSVVFDEDFVPHIFAENDDDLYFAQGFVVAKMRLWQMEFQTHYAAGRISEIVGPDALELDRLQRRKGLLLGAQKTLEKSKEYPEIWRAMDSFTKGVNAYIESLNEASIPVEYKILNYRPEPWTNFKIALLLQYMSDKLAGWDSDLQNTNARRLFGKEMFDLLFQINPEGTVPIIEKKGDWGFEPLEVTEPDSVIFPNDTIEYTVTRPDPDNGSNNWAVSGTKTESGVPILCNDTHLSLNLPSLWLTMHLNSPSQNVMGYTFTGSPGIIIGFNDSIAWGFTNGPRDTRDWYKIRFTDDSKKKYHYGGGTKNASFLIEEIKINGEEPFYDTIYVTHYGPVVYDETFPKPRQKQNYALRWTGHDASMLLGTFYGLNRAKNYSDYKEALKYWDCPPQNIVFASNGGDIALTIQGKFPLKWEDQGRFLMDGSDPMQEWQPFIPKDQSAYELNPERGFVSSANQQPTDPSYPYYFYNGRYEEYRNRIINRILDTAQNVSIQDMKDLQMNNYSVKAEEFVPVLAKYLSEKDMPENEKEALSRIKRWDFYYSEDAQGAIYFDAWWRVFYPKIWDEFYVENVPMDLPNPYITYLICRDYEEFDFYDIQETEKKEGLQDVMRISFSEAVKKVEQWKETSGLEFNHSNYRHTDVTHLARIGEFSIMNLKTGGHPDAINSMKGNDGPSQRLIVELKDKVEAWGILPGGQSGNPGSYYYDNYIEDYSVGRYRRLRIHFKPDDPAALHSFTFKNTTEE